MLRPFDVILTWGDGWISEAIELATHGGPSHVRVYCRGLHENHDFWEVTFPRCRWGMMSEIDRSSTRVEFGRHNQLYWPLPLELQTKGLAEMLRLEGSLYDLGELGITQFLHAIGLEKFDHSAPDNYVCSSGAERILTVMGFSFCPGDMIVSPYDILKSPYYEKVEET